MKLLAALLAVSGELVSAEWVSYRSPHFELYSDAREGVAREAAGRLELIRRVFLERVGPSGSPLPVRAFLFASEREFRDFRPNAITRGFYQSGPERDYIAMHDLGEETVRVVYHEYVHLTLNHSAPSLPRWLEEGTAEFYSTLQAKGDRLLIGMPVAAHMRVLGGARWLNADELAAVKRDSPGYDEAGRSGLFYAQSWALAHMLHLAQGYRKDTPRFWQLIYQGTPVELAFKEAYGKTVEAALQELRGYLNRGRMPVQAELWKPPEAVDIEAERLDEADAEAAQIELLLQAGRREQADARLRRLEKKRPNDPRVLTELAMLAMGARRHDEARGYFERAIAAGSKQSTTYFEYAMLLRDLAGEKAASEKGRVRELLEQAVGRNPRHAEAHFLLGLMAAQDGNLRAAIDSYEQAAAVLPRQSYFWHALALAYRQAGRGEEARRAARRSAESAKTPHEMEMARAALDLTAREAEAPPSRARADVNIPKSWEMPKGDARVEGMLERIDCMGRNARFHVRDGGGKVVVLYVEDPGRVLLGSMSGLTFEFTCGAQTRRRVAVEYRRKLDQSKKTEGEVTAIEFM